MLQFNEMGLGEAHIVPIEGVLMAEVFFGLPPFFDFFRYNPLYWSGSLLGALVGTEPSGKRGMGR